MALKTEKVEYVDGQRIEHITSTTTIGDDMITQSDWQRRAGSLLKRRDELIAASASDVEIQRVREELAKALSAVELYSGYIRGYSNGGGDGV